MALPFAAVEGPVGGGVAGFLPWLAPGLSLGFLGGIAGSCRRVYKRETRGIPVCLRGERGSFGVLEELRGCRRT